jgi:3-phosphoshikimate 1-carboxyvinyltransferase
MADISDTVQSLAAVALFAEGPTTVRGVAHNRVKETDRISDLACELRRLGATVEEFPDGLRILPPQSLKSCEIQTYHDHRMAMSLALVGLRQAITILDPACTAKTYPNYWQDLANFAGCRINWN